MSEVVVIVEGKTEEIFIQKILKPYLASRGVYIRATQVTKPGEKGGDVKFSRVFKDIERHIKQRKDTIISIFVDYYGIKSDWPGVKDTIHKKYAPVQISDMINAATKEVIVQSFDANRADIRFIPFLAVHEFESLLFSDSETLAALLNIKQTIIDKIIDEYGGNPESINNSPQTAPSKRLASLVPSGKFDKIRMGINVAEAIGIDKMRSRCHNFNSWLIALESTAINS